MPEGILVIITGSDCNELGHVPKPASICDYSRLQTVHILLYKVNSPMNKMRILPYKWMSNYVQIIFYTLFQLRHKLPRISQ